MQSPPPVKEIVKMDKQGSWTINLGVPSTKNSTTVRLAYLLFFSTLDTELLLAKSKQNQRQVYIERPFRRVLDPEIHLLTLEEKKSERT